MNAEQLLALYERVVDAPDAIARLRQLVLDLAVRGKLVKQNVADEPAKALLVRVARERDQAPWSGALRRTSDSEPISADKQPFLIPLTWEWVRFADLAAFAAGRTPPRHDASYWDSGDHAWVSIGDMVDGADLTSTKETVSAKAASNVFGHDPAPPGTMIMSFKLTIGKIARLAIPAFHNEAIISIRPFEADLDPYLFMVLPQFARMGDTKGAIKGATLNRGSISNILIPLPPLAEQHRIVAKVDELMALCDRLEAARAQREAARDRLTASTLARLKTPEPPASPDGDASKESSFQSDARFALTVLPALTTRPGQIKQLRRTILDLAIHGRLVPQDAKEPNVAQVLKELGIEQRATSDDLSRCVPRGWINLRMGQCFVVSGGIQKTPARTPRQHAYPYIGVGNVYRGRLDLSNLKQFELQDGELDRYRLELNDILIVEGNGSADEVGRCAVWQGSIRDCVHQNHIIRCRPRISTLASYVSMYLNSPNGMAEMKRLAITSAGLYSLSVGKVRNIQVPIPPLAEQHRIVAKVDELMSLCDQLEASLSRRDSTRSRLLNALLHEALSPQGRPLLEAA